MYSTGETRDSSVAFDLFRVDQIPVVCLIVLAVGWFHAVVSTKSECSTSQSC